MKTIDEREVRLSIDKNWNGVTEQPQVKNTHWARLKKEMLTS